MYSPFEMQDSLFMGQIAGQEVRVNTKNFNLFR
jgi:hypothetical protein